MLVLVLLILAVVIYLQMKPSSSTAPRTLSTTAKAEKYYMLDVEPPATVKGLTETPPAWAGDLTGPADRTTLYTYTIYQGNAVELKPGEEVEFMTQYPNKAGVTRIWKYKSIKKNQFKQLKFTGYVQKTDNLKEDKLVVYAEPRYGSVSDLEAYLNEDPLLQSENGLALRGDMNRTVIYTVAVV